MDWSKRRRVIIFAIFGSVLAVVLITIGIAIFYKTPTCIDQKQNQGETGVDCGGPCVHACTAAEKSAQVRFARAVTPSVDRTDVIAYVDNPNNDAAAHGVQATVEVYDASHTLLAARDVTFDLTPGAVTPVFVQGILSASTLVTQTFFTIHDSQVQWIRTTQKPVVPAVKNIVWQNTGTPRVTATLVNPVAKAFTNEELIATVFNTNGDAIAASRTLVASVPSQGTAPVVFTWNVPFASTPARVEVVPIVNVRGI